ncbi:hypothetical protein CEXT_635251, partial [Caerostris extrusa]
QERPPSIRNPFLIYLAHFPGKRFPESDTDEQLRRFGLHKIFSVDVRSNLKLRCCSCDEPAGGNKMLFHHQSVSTQ